MAAAVCLPACKPEPTEAERRAAREERIGTSASITAMFLVSAIQSCQVLGINDIDQCSKVGGNLIDEKSARVMAEQAIKHRAKYWEDCQRDFSEEYCGQLIRRAFVIEQRKPRDQ